MQMGLKLGQQRHDNAAALMDTFSTDAKSEDALYGSSLQQGESDFEDSVRDFRDPCSQDRMMDPVTCTLDTCNGRDAQVSPRRLAASGAVQGRSAGNAVEHPSKLPRRDETTVDKKDSVNNSREVTEANARDHFVQDNSQSVDRERAHHGLQQISHNDKLANGIPQQKDVETSCRNNDLDSGRLANGSLQQKALEISCRSRDLNSVKEFVVKETGKDSAFKELSASKGAMDSQNGKMPGLFRTVGEGMKTEEVTNNMRSVDQADISNDSEKKRRTWFHAVMGFVRGSREKGYHKSGSDERTSSMESSARKQSSDCKDKEKTGKRVKVHAHKKNTKEFADLYLQQQIQAHDGPIWVMKFSLDGRYLATGGCDNIVKVWEVDQNGNWSPEDSKKTCINRTSNQLGALDNNFGDSHHPLLLSEPPKWFLSAHSEGILDLSWSPAQLLLSSSMDKTVRLWNVYNGECMRVFNHNDYVTCVHFNPLNDAYFISGSLDGKVRIWSIKERQVVDWVELNEVVTAACYMPDGQGAVVGSVKGICRFYKKSEDGKLELDTAFDTHRKSTRSQERSITGIQFMPGSMNKVMLTCSDSRIRVYDGGIISSKYKGLRNTNGTISASFSSDGMYIICASEDSRVCIWKYYDTSSEQLNQPKKTLSRSFEDFSVRDVTIAILMPQTSVKSAQITTDVKISDTIGGIASDTGFGVQNITDANSSKETLNISELQRSGQYSLTERNSPIDCFILDRYLEDCTKLPEDMPDHEIGSQRFLSMGTESTWPDESLPGVQNFTSRPEFECVIEPEKNSIATHGFVILTAGSKGLIQIFQNRCLNL